MKALFLRLGAVLMFLLCSQAVYGLLHQGVTEALPDTSTELTPAAAAFSIGIYALVSLSLLFYWRSLPTIFYESKVVLCLPLFALLSVLWSQDPSLSLRRSGVLLVVSCIGACYGAVFTMQELSKLLTATSFLICVTTFVLAIVARHIVLEPLDPGVWRGVFSQKNVQGSFMALAFISALHSRFSRWHWIKYSTMAMALILLLLSHSSTSLLALLIVLAMLPFWRLTRLPLRQIIVAIAVVAVAVSVGAFLVERYSADLFSALGKNANLTGRTELWALILQSIARRPLLGYGYNGFWLGLRGESLTITAASGWIVPHAHNGLLDVLLGLGVFGGFLFLVTFAKLIGMIWSRMRLSGATMDELWPASFLVLLTVVNLTESLLLSANSIFWLLYVAVYANMARRASYLQRQRSVAPVIGNFADVTSRVPILP